jgi:hypothetical protein
VLPGDDVLVILAAYSSAWMIATQRPRMRSATRVKNVLTNGQRAAPPSPARLSSKTVVHSDNRNVTLAPRGVRRVRVATWFHAQGIDSAGFLWDGTFFTIVELIRIFCLAQCFGIAPCTDLSTDRVDKDERRYVPITCMTYVTNTETISGKPMVGLRDTLGDAFMSLAARA